MLAGAKLEASTTQGLANRLMKNFSGHLDPDAYATSWI